MYTATRRLIKERQQYSGYVIERVSVKNVGGGAPNRAFSNAYNTLDRKKGIKMTSGWIVDKFNKFKNSTEITQHFWNVDCSGNYFDTTPLFGSDVADLEYVIDCDIQAYGQKHYDQIDSCVASSLLLRDGEFLAVDIDETGRLVFRSIESLDTRNLFEKATIENEIDEATVYGRQTISLAEYMERLMSQDKSFNRAA